MYTSQSQFRPILGKRIGWSFASNQDLCSKDAAAGAMSVSARKRARRRSVLALCVYGLLIIAVLNTLRPPAAEVHEHRENHRGYVYGGKEYYATERAPITPRAVLPTTAFQPPPEVDGKQLLPKVRFLWGIMSTDRDSDVMLQQSIRRTYLNYYKEHTEFNMPHRICSLQEYIANAMIRDECELIYTFVIGGAKDHKAPTQMVDSVDPNRPLTLEPPSGTTGSDSPQANAEIINDVTYLNIKENDGAGKSATFFKWANSIIRDGTISVDYIAKVEMDMMLFAPRWFEFTQSVLMPSPYNRLIYGGMLMDRLSCGGLQDWRCRQMVNKNYMSNEAYFLSPDLAEFIVSDELDRSTLTFGAEDLAIGNYVNSCPHPIHQIVISPRHVLWDNTRWLGEAERYEKHWEAVKDTWKNKPGTRLSASPAANTPARPSVNSGMDGGATKQGTSRSYLDEFYRRVPWRWIPNFLTRVHMP